MEHLFDMRPDYPGYRLHRLEIFNWGTFDSTEGQVYCFEPQGRTSLLVGHNGSGKSTLVDAILTLLVDSRTRNYNVAAGAKKMERTTKSYIRGAYDRIADEMQASTVKYLRPQGSHWTALSAVFRDETLAKSFTLCQVLYLTSDGADERIFAMADEARELKDDLVGLRRSDEIRDHLKQLGYRTTKTYVEYHGWLASRTKMRGKAMDMFNQTVAVKDIQSLNHFIRRHMLEANDWRDKVDRLLTHFNDLSVAHQELVQARKKEELLRPIHKMGTKYRQRAEEQQQLERQLAAADSFFPLQVIELFEPEIADQEQKLATMLLNRKRLDESLKEKQEKIRHLKNEIDRTGGDRLREIPNLIKAEEGWLDGKKAASIRFHDDLRKCRIKQQVTSDELFQSVREQLRTVIANTEKETVTLTPQHDEAIQERGALQKELQEERSELEMLEQRRTNLPGRFTAIRSRICEDLQLDEAVLPFAAELISVSPEERPWEASVEMVLRPFALSMLVPERHYPKVRAYVEEHRLTDSQGAGQRLDYICVGKGAEASEDRLHRHSLVRKLRFKPQHDLAPWVRGEILRRFDFRCCEDVGEFNEIARLAMTQNRHVKFSHERHQKDDRPRTGDPRHFVLGWDNTEKKRRIAEHIQELEVDLTAVHESIQKHEARLETLRNRKLAANSALQTVAFDAIDVKKHEAEITALLAEKKQLEDSNDTVKELRKRLAVAEADELTIGRERDALLEAKGKLEEDIKRVKQLVARARGEVQETRKSQQYEQHEAMFASIAESLGKPPLSTVDVFQRRDDWTRRTDKKLKALQEPLQKLLQQIINAMAKFLQEFKEERDDLDATIDSLESFFGLLEQLQQEDLPRHEKKFKDRLNDQVSQEIAVFNTELRLECKQIEGKIGQLNKALADVEYNRGTYMRLDPRRVVDREIDEFRRSLRECLDESLEHTDEANEARFLRIQKLVQKLADKERTTWRNKVIDVRNWYEFSAREFERETQQARGCYDGSSGQSGGEKAKLAFTILVAALAYQFDIDPNGHTPGRFQFVVVDEMFSKVDDQNANFALKLFQQFGLQLLIVAPLDAKARATDTFVDRYLHVVKDPVTHHSQLYSMTAKEYEEFASEFTGNGKPHSKGKVTAK